MDREILRQYGIDYDAGLSICSNDPAFYEMLLSMFLENEIFPRARAAYEVRDYKTLFSCMHELKGVSGNVAMKDFYKEASKLVELLRGGVVRDQAELDSQFHLTEAAYKRALEGIRLAIG